MKPTLAAALEAKGYATLTPVQEAVTDPGLTGRDLLVSAQTGSGKTLGFGLAIAPVLLGEADTFQAAGAPLALIVAPTRELAMQVRRELAWLYAGAGAALASTVGGMDMRDERRALARGAHVVVATPGRLRDHIARGTIDLTAIRAVVLDEADEMLDLGFREDLEFILGACPADRQTLLFSATVPEAIARLAARYQRDAQRIATGGAREQHADIDYRALSVAARDEENAIINVLRYHEAAGAIVFCNTRAMVARLSTRLSNRGFPVVSLSGELSQAERSHALQAMRDGRARVCVATDVAARGIDLPNLDLVIHAELPTGSDTLLHRSGRTGRAGRKGTSVLIVPPAAKKKAHRLLGWAKLSASWDMAPSADDVRAKDRERMLDDPAWHEEVTESESPLVADLAARFSPEQLAVAYLRQVALRQTAPEDLSPADTGPATARPAFGPSVWFAVAGGRGAGQDPRRLLPVLCKAGGITRDSVGAIRIRDSESFVQIAQNAVEGFEAAIGPDGSLGEGISLRRSDGPPAHGRPSHGKPFGKSKPTNSPRPSTPPRKPANEAPVEARQAEGRPPEPAPRPAGEAEGKPYKPAKPGMKPWKARSGKPGGKSGFKPGGKAGFKPSGKPTTPQGKPNSKKNKARAAAKAAAKPKG